MFVVGLKKLIQVMLPMGWDSYARPLCNVPLWLRQTGLKPCKPVCASGVLQKRLHTRIASKKTTTNLSTCVLNSLSSWTSLAPTARHSNLQLEDNHCYRNDLYPLCLRHIPHFLALTSDRAFESATGRPACIVADLCEMSMQSTLQMSSSRAATRYSI